MYVLFFLLLLIAVVYAVVNTSNVQTYLAKKVATYLSEQLKTEVTIEKVEIEFIKTAVLHGLLINDLHHDTLICASKAKLDYTGFFKKDNRIQFSKIELENGRLKLKQYANEKDLNIDFFVDFIDPPGTVVRPKGYIYQTIASQKLVLKNIDFSYRFESDTLKTEIFNSSDIHFKKIFADIDNFKVLRDTVSFFCNRLETTEKCGLRIDKLNSAVRISPAFVEFNNFKLSTANSQLAGTFHLNTNSYRDYNNFEELVYMKGKFAPSNFELADAAYFNDVVKGLKMKIGFDGEIKGTESSLKGKNLNISFGQTSRFKGNVSMKGLPNWDDTYTHLEIDELVTNKSDLEQIQSYPFTSGDKLKLPKEIAKLGDMIVSGTFSGFESDFVSSVTIFTALGKLETDIEMKTNNLNQMAYYKGKLKALNFDLGQYYGMEDFVGKLTLDVDVNGHGLKQTNVNTNIAGKVEMFQLNNYSYKNITVDGNFIKDVFEGVFDVQDENAILDFDGTINLKNKLPSYNFKSNISYANLQKLGLTSANKKAIVSAALDVDIQGDNVDNLIGTIQAKNSIYQEPNKAYKINNIWIESKETNKGKKLSLISDLANGNIEGSYTLLKIGKAFKKLATTYVPALENNSKVIEVLKDNSFSEHFTFDFVFLNSQPLSKSFLSQVEILPGTKLNGHFYADENDFSFNCKAKEIRLLGYPFKQFELNANPIIESGKSSFKLEMSSGKILFSDSSFIQEFSLKNKLTNDSLFSQLNWLNNSKIKNSGDVKLLTSFTNSAAKIKLLQSQIFIQDSIINIDPANYLTIDSIGISFNRMNFSHNSQSITLNSLNTENSNEVAFVFRNFNIQWLNPIYKKEGIVLAGTLNGQGTFGFTKNNLIFTSTIALSRFTINDEFFGDGSLVCIYDDAKESIAINGKFLKGDYTVLSARGFYYPYKEQDNLDLEINLDKFSLKYAEIYTKGIFSNLNGYITGDLILKGSAEEPIVEGTLELQKSSFKIDYINTVYSFNGKVIFSENKISFRDIVFNDIKGNKGKASGVFLHDYFSNLKYKIGIEANKLMCLNTNVSQNEMFYGKAFASGTIDIKGNSDNVFFDIAAKSEKGTFFVIPLYGAEEISENSFIEFVKHDTIKSTLEKKLDLSGIEMKFELELTPDAEIQMMFDPKVGDAITGTGTGNLKMNIDRKGDFTMFGNYAVNQGKYLFTLQNVINKKFTVEQGGTIQWTGDPLNADINLNAIYTANTSLYEVYQADESRKRVPVQCKLMMTDKLMKPTIKFDIFLPTADQTTRDGVRSAINADNDADLNKQIFSLLMLGKFFPTNENTTTASSAAINNGNELLSNQISNWLGQTFKNLNLGLKMNSADENTNREIALATSTKLFNSRMTIDGTFGYTSNAANATNASNIIGDVNIDYKVTPDGKFKVRAFNRSNDYSTLVNTSQYIQGVGIVYREDFDSFGELIKRYKAKQRKKSENPLINDTIN